MTENNRIEVSFYPDPISSDESDLKVGIVIRFNLSETSKAYLISGLKNTFFFMFSID